MRAFSLTLQSCLVYVDNHLLFVNFDGIEWRRAEWSFSRYSIKNNSTKTTIMAIVRNIANFTVTKYSLFMETLGVIIIDIGNLTSNAIFIGMLRITGIFLAIFENIAILTAQIEIITISIGRLHFIAIRFNILPHSPSQSNVWPANFSIGNFSWYSARQESLTGLCSNEPALDVSKRPRRKSYKALCRIQEIQITTHDFFPWELQWNAEWCCSINMFRSMSPCMRLWKRFKAQKGRTGNCSAMCSGPPKKELKKSFFVAIQGILRRYSRESQRIRQRHHQSRRSRASKTTRNQTLPIPCNFPNKWIISTVGHCYVFFSITITATAINDTILLLNYTIM